MTSATRTPPPPARPSLFRDHLRLLGTNPAD
jgi:hypothetical protein